MHGALLCQYILKDREENNHLAGGSKQVGISYIQSRMQAPQNDVYYKHSMWLGEEIKKTRNVAHHKVCFITDLVQIFYQNSLRQNPNFSIWQTPTQVVLPCPEDPFLRLGQHRGQGHNGSACKWSAHEPVAAGGRTATRCCPVCRTNILQSSVQ